MITEIVPKGWKEMCGNLKEISATNVVKSFLSEEITPERIALKNEILMHFISEKQSFDLGIFLKNKCPICNGLGFDAAIFTTINVKCPSCMGHGWKIAECKRCHGTGKIGEIPCYTCGGGGIYVFKRTFNHVGKKCLKCDGDGTIKMLVQKIEEVKLCPSCLGIGVFKPAKNPVLEQEIGMELMKFINKNH